MDDDTKKILEDIRKSVESLAQAANEITDYLAWLRAKTAEREALMAKPATTIWRNGVPLPAPLALTDDPRWPYLAGRQPRRDGDNMINRADEHNPPRAVRSPR